MLATTDNAASPQLNCGVVPTRTSDPIRLFEIVAAQGAAILTGVGPSEEEARAGARAIFAGRVLALPEAAAVYEGGEKDIRPYASDQPLPLHTDGFAYGAKAPDYFLLSCVRGGDEGGESVLVDAYKMLDVLRIADPELTSFALETDVDQTEPGMQPYVAPLVLTMPSGRLVVRTPVYCDARPGSIDPEGDRKLIARWFATLESFRRSASRFALSPGELSCIDNYRFLHSRDGYAGPRKLWRVWVWTTGGNGVPDGILHSDARYAPRS